MEQSAVDYLISEMSKMNIRVSPDDALKLKGVIKESHVMFERQITDSFNTAKSTKTNLNSKQYFELKFTSNEKANRNNR